MTRQERTAEDAAKDLAEKVVRKIQNDRGMSSGWDLVFQDEIEGMFFAALRDAKRQTWKEAAKVAEAGHDCCGCGFGCGASPRDPGYPNGPDWAREIAGNLRARGEGEK